MDRQTKRQELKQKLREKIEERKINRYPKEQKDKIFEETLKNLGIDKKRLMKELDVIQKAGGKYELN
jgi:hypothetical protein